MEVLAGDDGGVFELFHICDCELRRMDWLFAPEAGTGYAHCRWVGGGADSPAGGGRSGWAGWGFRGPGCWRG